MCKVHGDDFGPTSRRIKDSQIRTCIRVVDRGTEWKNKRCIEESNNKNVHWLTLPGIDAKKFVFIIESNWSSRHMGYMLFASKYGEGRLLDIGSKMQKFAVSSYLGEFNALIWACKRTKAFREMMPVVVRTDNHALVETWTSQSLYDSDIRTFR